MSGQGWPPGRIARLERLVAAGYSATRIGDELALSRSAVIGKCYRLGLQLKGDRVRKRPAVPRAEAVTAPTPRQRRARRVAKDRREPWSEARVTALRELALAGATCAETAAQLGISVSAVKAAAKRNGVRFGATRPPRWSEDDLARLRHLVAARLTARQIADILGVTHDQVRHRCRVTGIRLNPVMPEAAPKAGPSANGPGGRPRAAAPVSLAPVSPAPVSPAPVSPASGRLSVVSDRAAPCADVPAGDIAAGSVVSRVVTMPGRTPSPDMPGGPVPVLDVREGQCRFPLWPDRGHVPFDQKFYCGAAVLKEGASWCAGCAARVWGGQEARDGQSLATSEPGLGRQDVKRSDRRAG